MDWNRKVVNDNYTANDMPEYPARTLIIHCAMKGAQVGSILGLISTPIYSVVRKQPILKTWRIFMPVSTSLGTVLVLGLLYGKSTTGALDVEGVDDRAYRLSKHAGQNEVDKASVIGSMIGVSVATLGSRNAANLLPGLCTGVSAGVAYYVLKPYVLKAINEK